MLTLNLSEISLLFYENPISRAYLNFLFEENIKIKNLIYLNNKSILPKKFNAYVLFRKNNYHAFKFLRDKNIKKLISEFEEYFEMPKNFCEEMYKFSKFRDNLNIIYPNSINVNSSEVKKIFSQNEFSNSFILNTGNQILKDVLKLGVNFFHIHPGYLPEVRGADGTLNSILHHNYLGVTSFIMTEKIDYGFIIKREKYLCPKFNLLNYHNYNLKDIYRIWYSFFDPLLRVSHFKKLFKLKEIKINKNIETEKSYYYSFLNKENLKKVFDKIFNQ